jgi:RNA polymerase-binding transcription factor DksA
MGGVSSGVDSTQTRSHSVRLTHQTAAGIGQARESGKQVHVTKKKTTKKKAMAKKSVAKKAAAKKSPSKKKIAKKAAAKKSPSKKKIVKKAALKKSPAKKVAKKKVAKKKATKKAAVKKLPAKKAASKKATAKKKDAKKTAQKKAPDKKAATKTTTTKAKAETKTAGGSRRRRQLTVAQAVVNADADQDGYVVVNGRRIRRIAVDMSAITKKRSSKRKAAQADQAKVKVYKSRLKQHDLDGFRELLLAKRREVLKALDSMEYQALRGGNSSSNMPIHMADVGSDAYEQDLKLGISASERERIVDIDGALQRISDGTYGLCEQTGKAIRKARLRAKPWARYSIDAARKNERRPKR